MKLLALVNILLTCFYSRVFRLGRGASPGKKVTIGGNKMQQSRTKGKCSSAQLIESLKKRTHFSRKEIEALLKLHRSLAASAQKKPLPRGQPPGKN